jgi:large conductance mechanosensitive channel
VSAIVNFLLKAAVVYFLIVRPFARLAARLAAAPPPPPPPAPEVVLLAEIRDLLKARA